MGTVEKIEHKRMREKRKIREKCVELGRRMEIKTMFESEKNVPKTFDVNVVSVGQRSIVN